MELIVLKFLTDKGKEAYHKVEKEGDKQNRLDKAISNKVSKEKIIQENPLIVRIDIKIPRLAQACKLDNKIVQGLKKFGALKGQDYTMEVC